VIVITSASSVVLSGLTIEGGRNTGIEIAGGEGNVVSGCRVRNFGGWGIVVTGGRNHRVERCELTGLGRGGVRLAGGERTTLEPAGHAVLDSRISHYARLQRTYAPGVKLEGVGQRVQNNEIFDAPHIAVWFTGNDHLIERNEIRGVCRETGDAGAIYVGRDWTERGTVIRQNYIHDVAGLGEHGCQAIYLDDMASGMVVSGNITRRSRRGILMGGGRDNVVEGNVLMDCSESIFFDNRGVEWWRENVTPPDGSLVRRLAQVPVDRPPWSTRHPELRRLLQDDPGWPKNNVIRRNVAYRCPPPNLAREVVRHGTVQDNETAFTEPAKIFPLDSVGPRAP
jgi:parallel beta-helix repeat protein